MRHGDHEFEPGIDMDNMANPSPFWCNVCGEQLTRTERERLQEEETE